MKNKEIVQKLYTEKNNLYHGLFFNFFRYDQGIRHFIKNEIIINPGYRILDAGCGSGLLTKCLYEAGREREVENLNFFAFDITKAMLDIFTQWIANNNIGNISLSQADVLRMNELPDSWDNFDLIVSSAMLEYLDESECRSALRNLKNRLTPDGKFFLIITKSNLVTKYLINKWWKANSYRKTELLKILREVGFEHVKIHRFPLKFWHLNIWGFILEA